MAALEAWRPSVADVAALVPSRVAPGITFSSSTKPTDLQVEGLIRGVQNEVVPFVGTMPDELCIVPSDGTIGESPAGHVVVLGAAALVEGQFFPDLQLGNDSPAVMLNNRYQLALKALAKAAYEIAEGQAPGDAPKPVGAFPATVPLGRATTHWELW